MEPPDLPLEKPAASRRRRWRFVPLIIGGLILATIVTWVFLTRDIPPIDDSDLALVEWRIDKEKNPYPKIRELTLKPDAKEKIARLREIFSLREPIDNEFLESVVTEYSEELAALKRFSKIDGWEVDYEMEIEASSPELDVILSLTQINRAQIELQILSGDYSKALESSISMLEIGRQFRNSGGSLIHFLVGTTAIAMAHHHISNIIQLKQLSGPELQDLANSLDRLQQSNESIISALKVEYQMGSEVLAQMGRGEIDLKDLNGGGKSTPRAMSLMFSQFKESRSQKKLADGFRHIISEVDIPRKEVSGNTHFDEISEDRKNMLSLFLSGNLAGHIILSMLVPVYDGILNRHAHCRTNQNILTLQVAAERYRLKKGGWPESLGQLVPEFIDAIPTDHMDGEPLRYNFETLRIYSVGLDFIDANGETAPDRDGPFRDRDEPMIQLDPTSEAVED